MSRKVKKPTGAKIVAVAIGKGGVGKTFTACSLAVEHYQMTGEEVLIVDLDPSVNTTMRVIEDPDAIDKTIADIFGGKINPMDAVYPCQEKFYPGVSVMASSKALGDVDYLIGKKPNREQFLRRALDKLRPEFGLIIIDCPPTLDILVSNALVACDGYMSPMSLDKDSIDGAMSVTALVNQLLEYEAIDSLPVYLKSFWSMFDLPKSHGTKNVIAEADEQLGDAALLPLRVSRSVHVREASTATGTLQTRPGHKVAIEFRNILKHVHTELGM